MIRLVLRRQRDNVPEWSKVLAQVGTSTKDDLHGAVKRLQGQLGRALEIVDCPLVAYTLWGGMRKLF